MRQGLAERRGTSVMKKDSRQVLALTERGQRLIRRHNFVPEDQAIYSGFVKPKEAGHDADLYRRYYKAAASNSARLARDCHFSEYPTIRPDEYWEIGSKVQG